jgi:2'-5' RNA ligase/ribosomal protein S18 acetylase RimI-like enzyme
MPRRRLGVALLVPAPFAAEIDGLRRACGDRTLGRVPPHITLVPPVNVREERVGEAVDVVRAAAAGAAPLALDLGPASTFAPVTPVVYLRVGGAVEPLQALRDAVFREPLARPLTHPFVPHVTLADGIDAERDRGAVAALADYRVRVVVERVHVLEEQPGQVWTPIADAVLRPPAIIGRGGLPLRLDESSALDDEGKALFEREWPLVMLDAYGPAGLAPRQPFAVTARREASVVGAIDGWTADGIGFVERLLVVPGVRGQGVGTHLLAAAEDLARRRGCTRMALSAVAGSAASRFHRSRGYVHDATRGDWLHGTDEVMLRRDL